MSLFRRHLPGVGQWVQIEARGADASNSTVSSASASSTSTRFKLSVPVIIGIVAVALILIGFGVLIWRWRVRVRETARLNRSYEKYGVGRGIESSNSYSTGGSTSKSSKADPYGSFFEVETEKPKKALLNFRRSSTLTSGSTSHGGHGKQGSGWNAPSSWQRQSKTAAAPSVPTQPPGLGGNTGKSMASSFSFSLRKSEEKKPPAPLKPQHLPNSIKSKGISAPLIVANGGPEPLWSPPVTTTSHFETQPQASSLSLLAAPPHPPASTSTTPSVFPQKLKQPQPRSPPATPGTSQKQDLLAVRRFSNGGGITSDGSLYSRNSFSSSNHDHSIPPPPPPAATPPPPSLERDVLPPTNNNHGSPSTTGGSGINGTVKQQQRNKSGNGTGKKGHTANQSSNTTNTYRTRESSTATTTSGINMSHQGSATTSPYHQPTGGYGSQNQSHPHHHSQLPRLMTVIAPFTPTMEDELPLKVGDTVRIIEEYRDAWCLVQLVGRIDSPRGVVPCVCLQERKRIIPVPMNV